MARDFSLNDIMQGLTPLYGFINKTINQGTTFYKDHTFKNRSFSSQFISKTHATSWERYGHVSIKIEHLHIEAFKNWTEHSYFISKTLAFTLLVYL